MPFLPLLPSFPTRSKLIGFGMALATAIVTPNLAHGQFVEPDTAVLRLLSGEQDGDYFGWLVANIGDLDGDGLDETLVPAIAYNGFAGRITVFSGDDGSVLNDVVGGAGAVFGYSVGAAGDVDGDSIADYIAGGGQTQVFSGADHHVIHDLTTLVGFSDGVHGAGDLNDDGFDDLIVGSQSTSVAAPNAGRVFAISGIDGSVLWTRDGTAEGDLLGSAVGAVGDVNFDQVPDVVAGASGAGAFDGGEALVLSGADGALIHTLSPTDPASASTFGFFFASGTGDLDGDQIPDIYIGDLDEGTGDRANTGAAYVFSGRTGRIIHYLRGLKAGEGFGLGRAIPDVNGDDCDDILVGAFNNSDGAPSAGAAYLFSGRSGALLRTMTATIENDNFGGDATGAGDVNGDGLPDFVITAPGLSFLGVDHGRAYLLAGTVLPCPADLSGNGFVGFRDFLRLKFAFGENGGPADLNGDGLVDHRDLIVLLRDWGHCAPGLPR